MVTKEIKSFARVILAAALLLSAAWQIHSQNPAPKGQKPVRVVPPPAKPPFDLTGTWSADDGGIYYVRQLGNTIWWAGLSTDSPQGQNDFQRGLRFTNVFRGTIEGNTIKGTWADIPRGQSVKSGTLTLSIASIGFPVGIVLERQSETGGFGGKTWGIVVPRNAPPCNNITAASFDIRCKFNRVKKNDGSTLYDNLKPQKDNVVIFGRVLAPLTPAYPGNAGRRYQDFIKTWGNGDGSLDGDIHFNVRLDRAKLNAEPNFWNQSDGWLYWPVNGVRAKLDKSIGQIHTEVMMYGRTEGGRNVLFPGWMERGGNSALWNGVPMDNVVISSSNSVTIGGASLPVGSHLRITGVLALDCGHCDFPYTSCHDCADNDAEPNNLEIHPVYSVEVLQDFRLPRPHADLTGVWAADDVGTYYVRQVGDTVWWLGLSRDRGQTFANVFQGTIQHGAAPGELTLSGDFADIPLGGSRSSGSIRLHGQLGSGTTSPTALDKLSFTGRFGAGKWAKLYDRVILKVGPVALP